MPGRDESDNSVNTEATHKNVGAHHECEIEGTKWGRKLIIHVYVLSCLSFFVILVYVPFLTIYCEESHVFPLTHSLVSSHLTAWWMFNSCVILLYKTILFFPLCKHFFSYLPTLFFHIYFFPACCRVPCRGQIFKVKRVRFWSGAQERCLHNSSRQMNGIFQSAALSIQPLWSVPTSQRTKKRVGWWGNGVEIQREKSWCLYSTLEHDAIFSRTFQQGLYISALWVAGGKLKEEKLLKCSNWCVTLELLWCNKVDISICI